MTASWEDVRVLFDPARHEPLGGAVWNEEHVRAAVREIAAEATHGYDHARECWPLHPLDAGEDDDDHAGTTHGIYIGAAGMLWALGHLERAGAAEISLDCHAAADDLHAAYLRCCHAPQEPQPGLWMGESGTLLVAETIAPGTADPDVLLAAIRANAHNPALDVLWGAPGTMLAAREMHRRTGDLRWAETWRESANAVLEEWRFDEELGCHLWTQLIGGRSRPLLGAAHGFAGSVLALADGLHLLPPERRSEIASRATDTALATVVTKDGLANWPAAAGAAVDGVEGTRTQWCHGAPGIVSSLAALPPDPVLDGILAAGGELTWQAGPLADRACLCHGTAGNGFAFLALFARTGDEFWLARARSFAMHSLAQSAELRRRHGQGWFGLWTGDIGTALYALQCIDGEPALPALTAW